MRKWEYLELWDEAQRLLHIHVPSDRSVADFACLQAIDGIVIHEKPSRWSGTRGLRIEPRGNNYRWFVDVLNALGSDGWELVSVSMSGGTLYLFKRPVQDTLAS